MIEPAPELAPLVAGAALPRLAVFDIVEKRFDTSDLQSRNWVLVWFLHLGDSLSLRLLGMMNHLAQNLPDGLIQVVVDLEDSSVETLKHFRLINSLESIVFLQDHYRLITREFSVKRSNPAVFLADKQGLLVLVEYDIAASDSLLPRIKNVVSDNTNK